MKNKLFTATLLTAIIFSFASCSATKAGRKGYGCPSTVKTQATSLEKNKV